VTEPLIVSLDFVCLNIHTFDKPRPNCFRSFPHMENLANDSEKVPSKKVKEPEAVWPRFHPQRHVRLLF
jgi:hypothetical protein